MAVMHELSLPIDTAINSFMARTKRINHLDMDGETSSDTDSDSDDDNSDVDPDSHTPLVWPAEESASSNEGGAAGLPTDSGEGEEDIFGQSSPGIEAFGHPAPGTPDEPLGQPASGIDDVDKVDLPKNAKAFLKHVSGRIGRDMIASFAKTLLRLLSDEVMGQYFVGQQLNASPVSAGRLLSVCVESMADTWFRFCFYYQSFPWTCFSLLLSSASDQAFRERWLDLRTKAQKCKHCVDTEFTAGIFGSMPWEKPVGEAQLRSEKTLWKGLLDIACKAFTSSDLVECYHHSSNLHVVRHKRGMTKQALNPVHYTMATYCLSFVADHQRRAKLIDSKVLPARKQRASIARNCGRKGCNQYSLNRQRPRKTIVKQKTKKPRRVSAWNVFFREAVAGTQLLPDGWAEKADGLGRMWRAMAPEARADYVIKARSSANSKRATASQGMKTLRLALFR